MNDARRIIIWKSRAFKERIETYSGKVVRSLIQLQRKATKWAEITIQAI